MPGALQYQCRRGDLPVLNQVGALAGLVPLPHKSGSLDFDHGISKAGSRRVRSLAVQIAWMWVRYQPQSALTQ